MCSEQLAFYLSESTGGESSATKAGLVGGLAAVGTVLLLCCVVVLTLLRKYYVQIGIFNCPIPHLYDHLDICRMQV